MPDRERLIDLLYDVQDARMDTIADYLLRNGVGVMPCKVGDSVYSIENRERIVKTYIVCCMRFEWFSSCTDFILTAREHDKLKSEYYVEFSSYHIGKTVFLTKEEAEKALAERIGK